MNDHRQQATFCRRSWRRVALYRPPLPERLADTLWNDPRPLLAAGQPLRCQGARSTVRLDWDGEPYVLKHYVEPTWRHALKQSALRSRARSTWLVAHKLADAGIATPRPVACVENRWGAVRRDSFLLYPFVEGRTLRSCFADETHHARSAIDSLWRQLRQLWERLIPLRASLGDANVGNFIVCPQGRLWVIDLDKARFYRLARVAARHQRQSWQQLLRSAAKCRSGPVSRFAA